MSDAFERLVDRVLAYKPAKQEKRAKQRKKKRKAQAAKKKNVP